MIDLLTAINNHFNATESLANAFPNGLELSAGQDAEALPLAVLTVVSAPTQFTTGNNPRYIEAVQVQVTFYATQEDGADTFVLTTAQNFDAAFNHVPITLTGDLLLEGRKINTRGPYKDDEKVWRIDLDYRFTVRR